MIYCVDYHVWGLNEVRTYFELIKEATRSDSITGFLFSKGVFIGEKLRA